MVTHKINPVCYRCICRVCGQRGCPHRPNNYKRCFGVCIANCEFRPIIDCKNFYLKQFPKYRIRRVYSRPKVRYIDKTNADDTRVMLTEILRILRAGTSPVMADVNCVRNRCICLTCPLADRCEDKCKQCKEYKGQNPVKLCAQLAMINKMGAKL